MRFRLLCPVMLVISMAACSDSTAPADPQSRIELSPFTNQIVLMYNVPNAYWSNHMVLTAPLGVDPILTRITFTPTKGEDARLEVDIDRPPTKVQQACDTLCTEVVWEYYVNFKAYEPGEAMAKVCVVANPNECRSFKVVVRQYPNEKG